MKRFGSVVGLALVGVLYGCATTSSSGSSSTLKYTEQDLSKASGIRAGMAMADVLTTMKAAPIKKDIVNASQEEWHYCRTGTSRHPVDQFVAIVFVTDGSGVPRVASVKNYTVTPNDTGGQYGDCSLFVKYGTYSGPRAAAPAAQYSAPQQRAVDPYSGTYNIQKYESFGSTTTIETWSNGGRRITRCYDSFGQKSCTVTSDP